MPRSPRKSIESAFGHLGISSSPQKAVSQSPKPYPPRETLKSFTESVKRSGWPSWRSLRWGSKESQRHNFHLTLKSGDMVYTKDQQDPQGPWLQSIALIQEIRQMLSNVNPASNIMVRYAESMSTEMANAIFGSNNIERAGLGLQDTYKICMRIFDGQTVDATAVDDRSAQYQANLEHLIKAGHKSPTKAHVIRSRREIIQHAQALRYITDAALHRDEPFSEQLILETHRILCQGIANVHQGGVQPENYAGRYRTVVVGAGNCCFTNPKFISQKMKEFVAELNTEIREQEEKGRLDPFYLAAKYSQEFVMIHPFEDGNGRTCRLILNAILIKYAGIVVNIGEHDNERKEYLDMMKEAGEEMTGPGALARMVLRNSSGTLRRIRNSLEG